MEQNNTAPKRNSKNLHDDNRPANRQRQQILELLEEAVRHGLKTLGLREMVRCMSPAVTVYELHHTHHNNMVTLKEVSRIGACGVCSMARYVPVRNRPYLKRTVQHSV